jgi:purine-binding chemotaxis protein CheW
MANELSTNVNEITQYIVIRIGEEQYGIDIKYIDNIVRMQQITRVPQVPVLGSRQTNCLSCCLPI